jgi:hypothetical protein
MPILENPRHEAFARELAKGKSATEAYEVAGFKPDRKNAHRLTTNDGVMTRIAELQHRAACRAVVTVESLIAEAEEARILAMKNGQIGAAVSAVTAKAKLAGLWLEKRENLNRIDPDQLSDARLMELIDWNFGFSVVVEQ